MACLRDIQRLFGDHAKDAFFAGFGNRITDAMSYRSVGIEASKIYTIDSTGVVKTELLQAAGHKGSYIQLVSLGSCQRALLTEISERPSQRSFPPCQHQDPARVYRFQFLASSFTRHSSTRFHPSFTSVIGPFRYFWTVIGVGQDRRYRSSIFKTTTTTYLIDQWRTSDRSCRYGKQSTE